MTQIRFYRGKDKEIEKAINELLSQSRYQFESLTIVKDDPHNSGGDCVVVLAYEELQKIG